MSATPNNTRKAPFRFDAHHRLILALVVGVIAGYTFSSLLPGTEAILMTWICFAISLIIPEWITILSAHPRDVRHYASIQDSSRTFIFLFVVGGTLISLLSIFFLMRSPENASPSQVTFHVCMTIGSVITSWWLVHTAFTLRYAHVFYDTRDDNGKKVNAGGLRFPEECEPDYMDLVYFSFNLGVAFQVSDVATTSPRMRRLVWMHSLIAFVFNTAIVALSINITSELLSKH
ncbi:DUF1345 domain-containing protein [Mucilaginibacter daejeonensis]|uniref:DUF1345 domain-containing protein n=1 Tax=Mucilaginibacter daejeonensis TaxID=398049 RepID=UPI001D171EFA|nr:DUF1345 domain-containing protein [Mucilaginibacter daejeonensis]UEG52228.1 DUF1345 domain-containing protein [Mucilaginibacter daejeonensis]